MWLLGLGRQLVLALVTLWVISVVTFGAINIRSPEAVAKSSLGREAQREQIDAFISSRGLDKPIIERYARWLGDAVRGDFGTSPITARSVRDDVAPRFVHTLLLAVVALVVAVPLSIAIGVYMARRPGSASDLALLLATVVVAAMPEFVLGIGVLMLFGVTLEVLPVDSTALSFGTLRQQVEAYILPALTLVLAMAPYMIRMARICMREALGAPFVRAALLRGLSRRSVVWGHAMPNAAIPLINAVTLNLVYLLGGVIVVENVFAFPGIGQLLVEAIGTGDTPTVQAIALVMGAMFIAINLLADVLVIYFNPRLRAE